MTKVRFLPSGRIVQAKPGLNLFSVASSTGVPLASACGGTGSCGLCRIQIIEGESHLSPYSEVEERHLGNLYQLTKRRLSCQTRLLTSSKDQEIVVEVIQRKKKLKSST